MSESKPTPGPWEQIGVYVFGAGKTAILAGLGGAENHTGRAWRSEEEILANCKLAASAPDLLSQRDELAEALEKAAQWEWEDGLCWCGCWSEHHEGAGPSETCKKARDALARVKK